MCSVALDHDFAKREYTWQGPEFATRAGTDAFSGAEQAVALFGRDDGADFPRVAGHSMDFMLRPGERLGEWALGHSEMLTWFLYDPLCALGIQIQPHSTALG